MHIFARALSERVDEAASFIWLIIKYIFRPVQIFGEKVLLFSYSIFKEKNLRDIFKNIARKLRDPILIIGMMVALLLTFAFILIFPSALG